MRDVDWPPARFREETIPGSQLSELNPISTSSVVLRRAFLPERMPPGFNELRVADYAVWALVSAGRRVGYIDRPMGAYRVHDASAYSSQSQRRRILEEIQTRVYIGQHIAEVDGAAWRSGLLRTIDYWLAENTRVTEERDRVAGDLAAVVACKTNLEHRVDDLVREIESLQASSSWRITAPLRWLRRRATRVT